MNPAAAYVPLAQYSAQPNLPIYDPSMMLTIGVPSLIVVALPLLIFVLRWVRFATSSKDDDSTVSAPGFIHTSLTLLTLPLVVALAWLVVFNAAAWQVAGGYDCSDATPVVHPRLGRASPDSNLCFNLGSKVNANATGVAHSAENAASEGINVFTGGQR